MFSQGFLYRRLAGFVPCALPGVASGALLLRNKWQVSSLRDVFLSSHYWRLFEHLDAPPSFIVDLGGHCGHFVVLSELVLEERFGRSDARYLIVEGLAELVDNIKATLSDTGIESRCTVVHGLVGERTGSGQLRSDPSNLLAASVVSTAGTTRGPEVAYVDLDRHAPSDRTIDILKVDIEGSEHALVGNYPDLLRRTRLVAMEVHGTPETPPARVLDALEAAGLKPCLPHISKGPNLLVIYRRERPL
jgi:FkbM family methyltransferase